MKERESHKEEVFRNLKYKERVKMDEHQQKLEVE